MNDRYEELRQIFSQSKFFKLVCGAGNENSDEVRKLTYIYTLAGCNGFDVSATPLVVSAAVEGINLAYEHAQKFGRDISTRPFITVSVGMPGDHHVRKAFIVDECVACGKCIPVCPTDAIPDDYRIIREKCIGCGNCEAACPPKVAAVRYEHNAKRLEEILPQCLAAGAENIELHAAVPDHEAIIEEWKVVSAAQPNNFISMCLDRLHLSNAHLIDRIVMAREHAQGRMIIQADGVPMSGGSDDFGTTLQAVACAEVIFKDLIQKDKSFKELPILLSGGTNTYTGDLARQCGVPFAGVSIGTHARKIVKDFIELPNFYENDEAIYGAIEEASNLIERNLLY